MMVLSDAARDDLTLVQAASDDALRALCNAALRCLREPEQSRDELLTTVAASCVGEDRASLFPPS